MRQAANAADLNNVYIVRIALFATFVCFLPCYMLNIGNEFFCNLLNKTCNNADLHELSMRERYVERKHGKSPWETRARSHHY